MADKLSEDVMKLSLLEDKKSSKPQPRKDYKLNIRKILSTHEAVGGMTLEGLYSRLSKKFGPLTDINKTHIQTALSALEEAKEIFLLACDTNNPKFRLVNHPEFKGYPQEWKLNLTDKKTFKPRKTVDTDEDKMFAFHITCACGHYHVQYIAEPIANLGKQVSFRCECGWRIALDKP